MKQPVETAYTGHGGEPEGEKEAGGGNDGPNMGSDSCSGFTSVSRTRYEDTDEYPFFTQHNRDGRRRPHGDTDSAVASLSIAARPRVRL